MSSCCPSRHSLNIAIVAWPVRLPPRLLDQNALIPLQAPSFRLRLGSLAIRSERQLWLEDLVLRRLRWLVFPTRRFFLALIRGERKGKTKCQLTENPRVNLSIS